MGTAVARVTPPRGQHLLTAADLALLPSELASGTVRYELHHGRLLITPPPGDIHGAVQANTVTEFKLQGERRRLGKARTEVGVILWRNPDHVLAPDVLFISNASLPLHLSPEGYLETIPDLAVEVRSKSDTDQEIADKFKDYLKAGVRVVWVPDPERTIVTVYRRGRRPKVFQETDTLTAEDIIPGFHVRVSRLFEV
jgi:Uma2 family endonuclease